MKVAIVINTSWNIYNYRRGIIKGLLAKGCEVLAVAPYDDYSEKLERIGCRYVSIRMDNKGANPLKDLLLLWQFYSLYKKEKPDVILHYTIKPNVYGSLAAALLGIPCISNVSGLGTTFLRKGAMWQLAKYLYRISFRFPKRIFFQNKDDRELFVSLRLVDGNRTGLLPGSGIYLPDYPAIPNPSASVFSFLLIARLLTDKGIREYAQASRMLKNKGHQFRALLVGFFDKQGKYSISQMELDEWCASGLIEFLGASDAIGEEIAKANCVVLPSYREGTPRSLLEAMAIGRPIVATNVPGCREVVEEGRNGFLCEAQNVESLAMAMEKVLHLSADELGAMGDWGRKIVEERFGEEIIVKKYFDEIFAKESTC